MNAARYNRAIVVSFAACHPISNLLCVVAGCFHCRILWRREHYCCVVILLPLMLFPCHQCCGITVVDVVATALLKPCSCYRVVHVVMPCSCYFSIVITWSVLVDDAAWALLLSCCWSVLIRVIAAVADLLMLTITIDHWLLFCVAVSLFPLSYNVMVQSVAIIAALLVWCRRWRFHVATVVLCVSICSIIVSLMPSLTCCWCHYYHVIDTVCMHMLLSYCQSIIVIAVVLSILSLLMLPCLR